MNQLSYRKRGPHFVCFYQGPKVTTRTARFSCFSPPSWVSISPWGAKEFQCCKLSFSTVVVIHLVCWCLCLLMFVDVCWCLLMFVDVCWCLLMFVGVCWCLLWFILFVDVCCDSSCLLMFVDVCCDSSCLLMFVDVCCDSFCLLMFVDVCWCLLMFVGYVSAFVASLAFRGFFELWCPLTSSNESESCSWCCWCLQLGLRQVDPSGLMGTSGSQRIHGAPLWSWGVLDLHLLCVRNSVPGGWFSWEILDETSQDKVMKGIKQGAFWQKRVISLPHSGVKSLLRLLNFWLDGWVGVNLVSGSCFWLETGKKSPFGDLEGSGFAHSCTVFFFYPKWKWRLLGGSSHGS